MAAHVVFRHISKSQNYISRFSSVSVLFNTRKTYRHQFQVRSYAGPSEAVPHQFDIMVADNQRKFYMLGGKGGVGKTSCAASLAVKFANHGHPTIVVSTDPAHSLSDSFDQDLTGGMLVPVQGLDSPLFALEINPENARDEFRSASQKYGGSGVKDLMDSMGLGMLGDQVMAVSESSRLHASLKKEKVPVQRLIVNQVLPPSATDCKFCATRRKDQMRALDMIRNDPELAGLTLIQAPLVDVEIRGVPALKFMGDMIWR